MRFWRLGFVAALAAATTATAQTPAQTCARGADVRIIEVLTPGEVGAACDLRYTRNGGANVTVPYHANNDAAYCAERARALTASLVSAGFECAAGASVAATEEALDVEELAGAVAAETETAAEAPAPAQLAEVPPAPSVLEQPPVIVAEAAPAPSRPAVVATQGPAALAPTTASTNEPIRPALSSVGRLTGASPDEPPLASVEAQPDRLEPVAAEPTSAPPPRTASPATRPTQAAVTAKPRAAPDVIRAVLHAQAAAWNDGDLNAFMEGYWKDPNLRFVSGTAVTKGWAQTLQRYRDRYGSGVALGRLSFDGLDVQMLSDDVAIVVGRFNLARDARQDSGAFTLVVQRFDGLWRIVHDHTVADATSG